MVKIRFINFNLNIKERNYQNKPKNKDFTKINLFWVFPFGPGFSLQSFIATRNKSISAAIPNTNGFMNYDFRFFPQKKV